MILRFLKYKDDLSFLIIFERKLDDDKMMTKWWQSQKIVVIHDDISIYIKFFY